jgi:hypothetical protein
MTAVEAGAIASFAAVFGRKIVAGAAAQPATGP